MALLDSIRGVILDLDGTLIDSMQIWHEIDIAFFAENGLELPEGLSEQVAKMSITEWAELFVSQYVPRLTPAQVIARIEEMAAEFYRSVIPIKPHVTAFLDALDAREIPYGVCTATYYSSAQAVLSRLGLRDRMQFVMTGEDFPEGKSAPDMYLAARDALGVPEQQILVVEDALHCVELAVRCGFVTAAVHDDSTPAKDWQRIRELAAVSGRDLGEVLETVLST